MDNVEPEQPCDEHGEIKLSHYGLEAQPLTFWLVRNPKHNLAARMMRLGLSFRWNRFTKRQNLCRDWLDLAFVDQVRDLSEIFGIRMNPNSCSANPALRQFSKNRGARPDREPSSLS